MTKSAIIQNTITDFLADGSAHTVQEMKAFLKQSGITDYNEGHFSGSINTMLRNKSIRKISRGCYAANQDHGGAVQSTQTINSFLPDSPTDASTQENQAASQLLSQTVLPMLQQIQDSLTELKELINKRDVETIQAITRASLDSVKKEESSESALLKLLPELLRNPDAVKNLVQLTELLQQKNP